MFSDKNIPDLKVERMIDEKTGAPQVYYLYKDLMVQRIEISGIQAERISGLSLIQKDLINAKQWIHQVRNLMKKGSSDKNEKSDDDVNYTYNTDREIYDQVKGLFIAALIFYGKAFTEANGRKAQIQRDWLDQSFRESHDFYMNFRHNFAAHSGDAKFEYAQSSILLIPENKNKYSLRLVTNRVQPDAVTSNSQEKNFELLIEHVIDVVNKRYMEKSNQILQAAKLRGLEFWMVASHMKQFVNMDEATNKILKKKKR